MSTHSYPLGGYGPGKRSAWGRLVARDSAVWRMDWVIILSAIGLSIIGSLLVWSATRHRSDLNQGDPYYFLTRHIISLLVGVVLMGCTVWVGHRRLRGAVPILYGAALFLALLVLTPLGATINGQRAWLNLGGGLSLQPAEFIKITVILGMAMLLGAKVGDGAELKQPAHRTVLKALGVAAAPIAVIMLMPDLGSVMVMIVIVLGVLLASGASNRWIIGLCLAGAAGAVTVWAVGLLDEYQIDRFAAFANPALDPAGVGYNTNQARIAVGSGGLLGKGLFHGSQTTGQFVPEQQTDFVFTVAGEELGFLGGLLILVLLGVVIWRACRIAREASELYSTMVAIGIIAWFAFQSFENIGMTLGIMPVAGLPLPFVSYGGTSMFAVWIALGLLQSIRVQRPVSA
jgi:rod shape determining protein RodA